MNETNDSNNPESLKKNNNKSPKKTWWLRLILILLIVFLSGTVIIKIASPQVQPVYAEYLLNHAGNWPSEFSAAFDDDTLSYWKPTDDLIEESIIRFESLNEHMEIVFAPTNETTVRDAFFNKQALASEDFLLEMEITPPTDCHTGPIFRGNKEGEYYLFLVSDNSYTVEILPRNSDADLPREAIIQNTAVPNDIGQPRILNVLAYNDDYYFYINHSFVDKMSDLRLEGDQIGIELFVCQDVTHESLFRIDGFSLRQQ